MKRPGARKDRPASALRRAIAVALTFSLTLGTAILTGCAGGDSTATASGKTTASAGESTSGPAFEKPALALTSFNANAAITGHGGSIDISSIDQGYVVAAGESVSRLKFQVSKDDRDYNYDLPNDGTPIFCPLNMGDGGYVFRIMQNTSGNSYVEITNASANVVLASEFEPFLRPNVYCTYDAQSASVAKANELAANAQNDGDVLRNIYNWITDTISYDTAKAEQLANSAGYVPNPDATLAEGKGICFDYVSLGAAMLRSQGIPCKIVTGYVSPDNIYHAWNLVYLEGSWIGVGVNVEANTWTRIDLTFAAGGAGKYAGDAKEYTDRDTY